MLIVRLFRRWAAAQALDEDALGAIIRLADEAERPVVLAVALHSVLQVTQECLGRPLEPSCHGSAHLSRDEQALLALLAHAAKSAGVRSTAEVPHGLPGVLCWSVGSLRRLLDEEVTSAASPARCPFRRTGEAESDWLPRC